MAKKSLKPLNGGARRTIDLRARRPFEHNAGKDVRLRCRLNGVHLDMLLPCGLPEDKAVFGDDFIAGVRLCLRILLLRPGEGASVNHKRTHQPSLRVFA